MQIEHATSENIPDKVVWRSLKNLIERFKFTEAEALTLMGAMARSTYYKGLKTYNAGLTRDQRDRVSYLLGIYKNLRILFIDSEQAMSWINRPNDLAPFNGLSPKDYLLEGSLSRLEHVRRFLDFWRGY